MDIFISKRIRNFILLAQANNIARTTEKTHMTASPFGRDIATLEEQIGYALFTCKDNNVSLSKAGWELYQRPFPVYQRLSAIDNEIHNSGRRSREIMIGIDNTYPTIILDQLISLGDKYEGMAVQLVEFSENGVVGNLFDHQLDFIISPQHVPARVQELENLTIGELPPLRLGLLVSRRYKERQEQELLQKLPWLQMHFQSRADFGTVIDASIRSCGINPAIIYRPYSFMAKISAVEHGHLLTVIPHFAWRLMNPATLKYFNAPRGPICMQGYLYSVRDHRYTATMLQHITEGRDGTNH